MFSREKCVICCSEKLNNIAKLPNFPTKYISENTNDTRSCWDMVIGSCKKCGSVQHMNLLDPAILYGGKYSANLTFNDEWNEHYDSFADFITKNLEINSKIVEIGSSLHIMCNRLYDYYPDYTIFDFSLENVIEMKPGVKYIEGNCETHQFQKGDSIVMSHVFEHLYEPCNFIKKCMETNVYKIFLSLPNMEDDNNTHLSMEHTFRYNDSDILYIFGKYKYKCIKTQMFKNFHSIFYCFQLTENTIDIQQKYKHANIEPTKEFFLKQIAVPENTYIVTAGYWGNYTYYCVSNKENIIGFIDNDPIKQSKYITPYISSKSTLSIQPFSIIANKSNVNVLILSNKYWTDELVQQIRNINNKCNIIML